ncbi:Fe-S cluster assembly protein HesB [Prosthecochloris sp. GSB1]|uniref:DNA glycosylase n=1 Tax=Prosthecochloris sp. GSB1 TaxID=281093 RepID=UPI000B8C734B|nr:DNA glycosylase [Prosthecochloris sp. GSB1]ASQ90479.1 Fe-S cluster assembly protein HesB [Prosthecochloris sp. GSB1]
MKSLNKIILKYFDIKGSIFSGQSFRWRISETDCQKFIGVVAGELLILEKKGQDATTLYCSSPTITGISLSCFATRYFSLDIDNRQAFPESFARTYPTLWALLQPYLHLKLLRQEPFETLITFMCAQGIGMRIIRRQVDYLSRTFGRRCTTAIDGEPFTYHAFPTPDALAAADPDTLRLCTNNNCARARNIIDAAVAVASGKLDLEALKDPEIPLDEARNRLCAQHGIGLKIADCILLFGLCRHSAFPIDTHVHQYLAEWFSFDEALKTLNRKNYLLLQRRATELFNPDLAGLAGHILFHAWRKEIKRLESF